MKSLLQVMLLGMLSPMVFAAEVKPLNLEEVLSVIRTNMSDISEAELNQEAAEGLIKRLGTRVQLVEEGSQVSATKSEPDAISKTAVYQDKFGYIRIKSLDERITNDFHRRVRQLLSSNELSGLIIDLRYAQGTNYEAAARVGDEFVGAKPLIKLGEKQITGSENAEDIRKPLAVLVNSETRAAAEALAGLLKESAAALVIGGKTAGEARLYEVFTLSTGHKLRVGKVPVQVGPGKTISAKGIVPDIEVKIDAEEELAFYQDPYRERRLLSADTSTNAVPTFAQGRPLNEAELVRRHRSNPDALEQDTPAPRNAPEVAVITDPTLARALDFLKGISILQPRR